MIRTCSRCEELTDNAYCITIYPESTNGIVERYFVCKNCVDKILDFIKFVRQDTIQDKEES